MPNSDLVPQGLPYGERQKTEAAMQQAGVPRSSVPAAPLELPTGGGVSPTPPPTSPPSVASFDALANRQPPDPFGAQAALADPLQNLRQSPNALMRAVADLMPEYMQRR